MTKKDNSADALVRRRRRTRRQFIGFLLSLLAIIGMVTVVVQGVHLTQKLFDDSEEKAAYEKRLTYIVMMDMLPFDSLEKANQTDLLESCLWAALYTEDSSTFSQNEAGALLLSSTMIDHYAMQLFGPDYKLLHATFESDGMIFNYDEESGCYIIPFTAQVGNYTPKVVEISGTKSVQRVTVGYLQPYSSTADFSSSRDVNEPVKYYDYLFTHSADGNYYLTSMEESSWVSNVKVESEAQVAEQQVLQVDPNAVVDEATNSSAEEAIADELQNAETESAAEAASSEEEAAQGEESAAEEETTEESSEESDAEE